MYEYSVRVNYIVGWENNWYRRIDMLRVHPEFVVGEGQEWKAVLLPYDEWQKIVEEMEELDDIRAYDEGKSQPSDSVSFDTAVKEIREGNIS